jgi:signal transduction histidine kinase/CheY-like chemotaxis protein
MRETLESQLRALMNSLPFASWFKDSEGRFTHVNRILLQRLDKTDSDILGKVSREVFDEEDTKLSIEGENDVLHTGRISQATHSRDKRVYKTVNFPVFGKPGEIIGTGGYQEDITNLTASLQALHRERETLEVLLESMPYYIFFIDTRFRYLRINSLMARLLRVADPRKATGKGNEAFFTKRVAKKMLEEDQSMLDTGKAIINRIIYFEDEGIDGFWMEKTKIPIRDERGVITMIIGIYKDVTEMMDIESELKRARDRAQESDRLKTAFLANMSHEIRTPMNGIVGFVNLLKDQGLTDEQKDLYLKHVEQSSNQLLNIVNDIIDISKIESGQLKIANRPVRINGVLDEIYSSFFHRIRGDAPGQKKVTFTLQKGEKSPEFTIVIDSSRLSQIFNNLISNAIKFTEEGQIIFGYSLEEKRHIRFFVQDTGIGIAPDKIEMIFDRFGQIGEGRVAHPSGTGLGLSISKSLVQLMGGEMWAESTVGKGSVFYFTLPLVVEGSVQENEVLISNKTYEWKGKQVLVAEDEELNWMFIREMLRKTGAEVVRARNGSEAVKMAEELTPDMILMDIKMPQMDGIAATRRIRKFNTGVPIIAQTAFVMAEEKAESLKAGCNHFVTKPLDRTILMELIESYFRKA